MNEIQKAMIYTLRRRIRESEKTGKRLYISCDCARKIINMIVSMEEEHKRLEEENKRLHEENFWLTKDGEK